MRILSCSLTSFSFDVLNHFGLVFPHFYSSSSKGRGGRYNWYEIRVKATYIWFWFLNLTLVLVTLCYMNPPDNFLQESEYYLEVSSPPVLMLLFIVKYLVCNSPFFKVHSALHFIFHFCCIVFSILVYSCFKAANWYSWL